MTKYYLLFFIFSCWLKPAICQSYVGKQQIIAQLRLLRGSIASLKLPDVNYTNVQNSSRDLINDALINISSRNDSFPAIYLESLVALKQLADGLSAATPYDRSRQMDMIHSDLTLKFKSGQQNLNGGPVTQLVPMSVYAYRRGRTANFLRVNYSPLAYLNGYHLPWHQFAQLTSPANEQMVPGIYELWLTEDGQNVVLQKRIIEVDPSRNNHRVELNIL